MALFGFSKKKAPAPASKPATKLLWSKTFTQSNSFKGFRRVQLTTYKEPGVEETLAYFKDLNYDFKGRTIRIDHLTGPEIFEDGPAHFINVYVDNMKIGVVYGTSELRFSMLTEYEFDKAHIKVENGVVFLFVHYPGVAPIKVSTRVE